MKIGFNKVTAKAALAAAFVAVMATGAMAAPSAKDIAKDAAMQKRGEISEDEARRIAFKDAGVREQEVKMRNSNSRDMRNQNGPNQRGRRVYRIEFDARLKQYSYEIDAENGRIINKDVKGIKDRKF